MEKEKRNKIRLELDPELLPETVEFFELHKDEDIPAYDFADALTECDKTVAMPRCLFDFIVSLYENAIRKTFYEVFLHMCFVSTGVKIGVFLP